MLIDTLKIKGSMDCLTDYRLSAFSSYRPGIAYTDGIFDNPEEYEKPAVKHALNARTGRDHPAAYIEIAHSGDVLIEFSAKVLRGKYLLGITTDTFQEAIDNINQVMGRDCQLNAERLISSEVVKIHNAVNVDMSDTESMNIIHALQSVGRMPYKEPNSVFGSTAEFRTKQETLTIYDKKQELIAKPGMLEYSEVMKQVRTMEQSKRTLLRTEYKLNNKGKTKEVLFRNQVKQTVEEAIKPKNSNIIILHAINKLKATPEPLLFDGTIENCIRDGWKLSKIEKVFGIMEIWESVGRNEHKLREVIQKVVKDKGNQSKKFYEYMKQIEAGLSIKGEKVPCSDIVQAYKRDMIRILTA